MPFSDSNTTSGNDEAIVSTAAYNSFVNANKTASGAGVTVDAYVSGSNLANRKTLVIYNNGLTVEVGPSGFTTGMPLLAKQTMVLNVGPDVDVEVKETNGANTIDVIIQEFA